MLSLSFLAFHKKSDPSFIVGRFPIEPIKCLTHRQNVLKTCGLVLLLLFISLQYVYSHNSFCVFVVFLAWDRTLAFGCSFVCCGKIYLWVHFVNDICHD